MRYGLLCLFHLFCFLSFVFLSGMRLLKDLNIFVIPGSEAEPYLYGFEWNILIPALIYTLLFYAGSYLLLIKHRLALKIYVAGWVLYLFVFAFVLVRDFAYLDFKYFYENGLLGILVYSALTYLVFKKHRLNSQHHVT